MTGQTVGLLTTMPLFAFIGGLLPFVPLFLVPRGIIGDIPIEELSVLCPPCPDTKPDRALCPNPPANNGNSSSSSTQSSSSPIFNDGRPEITSRIATGSLGGEIARISMGRCCDLVCHPGGSSPHDFFQLERPIEPALCPGLINGACLLCATNVAGVVRLGVLDEEPSSIDRLFEEVLRGEHVLGLFVSLSS
jgi:hypothetical protein